MAIRGAQNLSTDELNFELARGGRFVVYYYCISLVVITFRRGSPVYFLRAGESAARQSLPWTLLSLVAGWWGIPFGPIFTVQSVYVNCRGGKDVTAGFLVNTNANKAAAAAI